MEDLGQIREITCSPCVMLADFAVLRLSCSSRKESLEKSRASRDRNCVSRHFVFSSMCSHTCPCTNL